MSMRDISIHICILPICFALAACLPEPEPPEDPHAPPAAMLEQHEHRDALLERYEHQDELLEEHEAPCEAIGGASPLDRLDKYDCLIQKAHMLHCAEISPLRHKAKMWVESSGREDAESHKGARGLMQLKPSTFRSMLPRGDIDDPEDNITAGVAYSCWAAKFWRKGLRSEEDRYGALADMTYNFGPGNMLKAQSRCGGYTSSELAPCTPRETRDYPVKIQRLVSQ